MNKNTKLQKTSDIITSQSSINWDNLCDICARAYDESCEEGIAAKDVCTKKFVLAPIEDLCKAFLLNTSTSDNTDHIITALIYQEFDICMLHDFAMNHKICPRCDGSGSIIGAMNIRKCDLCHGSGIWQDTWQGQKLIFEYTISYGDDQILDNSSIHPTDSHIWATHTNNPILAAKINDDYTGITYPPGLIKLGTIYVSNLIPEITDPNKDLLICVNTLGFIEYVGTYAGLANFLQSNLWEDFTARLITRGISVFKLDRFNIEKYVISRNMIPEVYNALLFRDVIEYIDTHFINKEDQEYRMNLAMKFFAQFTPQEFVVDKCIDILAIETGFSMTIYTNTYEKVRNDFMRYGQFNVSKLIMARMLYDIREMLELENSTLNDFIKSVNTVATFVAEYAIIGLDDEV